MNIRAQAAKTLAPIITTRHSLQSHFDSALESLPTKDRALFHQLCYGCLRQFETLDAIAAQLLQKKLKDKDSDVYALLLLGLYQLRYMRTPDHAALAETVAAASKLKKPWAKNLINGVLRNYLREADALYENALKDDSARYACPAWLLHKIKHDWYEYWQDILIQSNEQAAVCLRIDLNQHSREEVKAELELADVQSHVGEYSPSALWLEDKLELGVLRGFQEGYISIQDEAAQLAAYLLDAQAGERILDACAAPGGKTAHIIQAQPAIKSMHAVELEENRIERMQENFDRLKLNPTIHCADASEIEQWWQDGKTFDRILLDAPCSATGILRRHPDIKRLRRKEDIKTLNQIQLNLLQRLWQTLKPGGILLYATCSILKQENEQIIKTFLANQEDAQHCQIDAPWGVERPFGRQLFPKALGHDGFYYAKLKKHDH